MSDCRVCAQTKLKWPQEQLMWKNTIVRWQPPIVASWCSVPRSRRAEWPCGYKATTCKGDSIQCPRCLFNYCDHHFNGHIRTTLIPVDPWRSFRESLSRALDEIHAKPRRRINIPKPNADDIID